MLPLLSLPLAIVVVASVSAALGPRAEEGDDDDDDGDDDDRGRGRGRRSVAASASAHVAVVLPEAGEDEGEEGEEDDDDDEEETGLLLLDEKEADVAVLLVVEVGEEEEEEEGAACDGGGGGGGGGKRFPVSGSTRFSSIQRQFSSCSSGHSARKRAPPSPERMTPVPALRGFAPPLPPPLPEDAVAAANDEEDDDDDGDGEDEEEGGDRALAGQPLPPVEFHQREREASQRRSCSVALMLPVVISSLVMKDSRPTRMVEMPHAGLNDLGWKSLMLRHRRVDGWKRPLGVCMRMAGGAYG
jgi:hypothetical protein